MTKSDQLLARRDAVMPRGAARLNNLVVESGSGAELCDVDGRRYLDFATGIGVMGLGHSQPKILEAIARQATKLQHVCSHVATCEPYVELCEKLAAKFPHGRGGTKVFLLNSGAEAVENAVKVARQATGRPAIICFTEAFHGRTLLSMSLTSKVAYKKNCGPFAPEIYRLPFPNHYRYGAGLSREAFIAQELLRFQQALVNTVTPDQVAAVIVEVVQGEGGFVPCPLDYLRGLKSMCADHGILLILDEVQSGFCRTGRWAAYEHAGITPDLSTWAKALGAGLPIAAVIGRQEIMDRTTPGTLGGTFGGNPVACAAALASIALMEEHNLAARAGAIGELVMDRLSALQARSLLIGEVRGLGAMMAMELVYGGDPNQPATAAAAKLLAACLGRGLLLLTCGAASNVVRLLPPLTVTDVELVRGLDILETEVLGLSPERSSYAPPRMV